MIHGLGGPLFHLTNDGWNWYLYIKSINKVVTVSIATSYVYLGSVAFLWMLTSNDSTVLLYLCKAELLPMGYQHHRRRQRAKMSWWFSSRHIYDSHREKAWCPGDAFEDFFYDFLYLFFPKNLWKWSNLTWWTGVFSRPPSKQSTHFLAHMQLQRSLHF